MAFDFAIIAVILATIAWAFDDFFIQKSVRKIGDLESLAFIGLFGAICLLPFVLNDISLLFLPENILLLLLLTIITFVAALFDFEALKKGKLSVIDVVVGLELPVTIILAFIFLGESATLTQYILIAPIFLGIILMSLGASHKKMNNPFERLEKGVVLGLIAALGMGLIDFFTAVSARQVSLLMAIWVPWLVIGIVSTIIIIKQNKFNDLKTNTFKHKWLILSIGVFDTAAWLLYAIALNSYNIGVITAITQAYPAIALFFGVIINKEKLTKLQLLGGLIALTASVILGSTLL